MNRIMSQGMAFSYGVLYIFSYPLFSFAIHCLLARFSYRTPGRPVPPVRVRPTDRPDPPVRVIACQRNDGLYFNVPPDER